MATSRLVLLISTIILAIDISRADDSTFACSPNFDRVNATRGHLHINRNVKECGFMAMDDATIFAIRTDELRLKSGDKLVVGPDGSSNPRTFTPPFKAGYLLFALKESKLTFTFDKLDNTSMLVEFVQNTGVLPVDGDIDNNFEISPIGVDNIVLEITQTKVDMIHLEVFGARIAGRTLPQELFSQSSASVPIQVKKEQPIKIKTSHVVRECSGYHEDDRPVDIQITGLDPTQLTEGYKCVHIFKISMPDQAHFEVDFPDFIYMIDRYDRLTLRDGSSPNPVSIIKSDAANYVGRTLTFRGQDLIVVYESPRIVKPSATTFKLTVRSKQFGGIVDKPGLLAIPSSGIVKYVLHPAARQYAAVSLPSDEDARDVNITVMSYNKLVVSLKKPTRLPPNIVLNHRSIPMTIEIEVHAKNASKWTDKIEFKSLASSCHKLSTGQTGNFSVIGPTSDPLMGCQWILVSAESFNLQIDYNNLSPGGCLTIQPLDQEKPVFRGCNIPSKHTLPTFNLTQAYVIVTLESFGTSFEASYLSEYSLDAGGNFECGYIRDSSFLRSSGYPNFYIWSTVNSQYNLSTSARYSYCIVTIHDIDIRQGETMMIDKVHVDASNRHIIGDIVSSANWTDISIIRSGGTEDYSQRKGFMLETRKFNHVMTANLSGNSLTTPRNTTCLYIKISAAAADIKTFGQRIEFNVSIAGPDNSYYLEVFDSRYMRGLKLRAVNSNDARYHYTSTSDTVVFAYTSRTSVFLPEMRIDYRGVACNLASDHVCDNSTRCVPVDKLCKAVSYCDDGTDIEMDYTSSLEHRPELLIVGNDCRPSVYDDDEKVEIIRVVNNKVVSRMANRRR